MASTFIGSKKAVVKKRQSNFDHDFMTGGSDDRMFSRASALGGMYYDSRFSLVSCLSLLDSYSIILLFSVFCLTLTQFTLKHTAC